MPVGKSIHDQNRLAEPDANYESAPSSAARPSLNNGYTPDKSDTLVGDRFGALEKLVDAGTIRLLNEHGGAGSRQVLTRPPSSRTNESMRPPSFS